MAGDAHRRTLATLLEERDRGRFAGREAELAFLDLCLESPDPPASVVHIYGPGGIGKSALLREVTRRARSLGIEIITIDGRELGPAPGKLEAALSGAASYHRPLVVLDSYERMRALDPHLRRELLPRLPDRSLVLIAGRGSPDPGWFSGGWEALTTRLELDVLVPREAGQLLAAHGLSDERVPAIVDWAAGSPLALALAADTAIADPSWSAAADPGRPDILRSVLHRLVGTELGDVRPSALSIAIVARTTTPALIKAVLAGEDADRAYRQLAGLSVSEQVGDGIAMHELVRKAMLADLKLRNPELERDLRRRIVDYLYSRAVAGEPLVMIDMAHLVENPVLRWGFGWDGNVSFRIDSVSAGDVRGIERQYTPDQNRQWWRLTRRYFSESPERAAVARDRDDQICGFMVCMSVATAPAFAGSDPLIGPWLAHARANLTLGESVLWHAAVDRTGQGTVQAMLGMAGVLRSGVVNPRFAYLPIDPSYPGALEFAQALGATHLAHLDVTLDGQVVQCHHLDYGTGGLFAHLRAQIYSELGLPAP
ncbi:MAG TPA: ATP-binding protein, partial [Streptosporangiaceae bacterium]